MASLPHRTPVPGGFPSRLSLGGETWSLLPGRTLLLLLQAFPQVHLGLVALEQPLFQPDVLGWPLD